MKNSKAFYRSALATAIVMALSAPAFAADNAVSTTPVTLDKDIRQLWNKMLLLVVLHRLQPQQLMRKIKTLMLLWVVMILPPHQR